MTLDMKKEEEYEKKTKKKTLRGMKHTSTFRLLNFR